MAPGADVVAEPRQRELGGACPAADLVLPLEHQHGHSALRERDGRSQPVGAGPDDDGVGSAAHDSHPIGPFGERPEGRDCPPSPARRALGRGTAARRPFDAAHLRPEAELGERLLDEPAHGGKVGRLEVPDAHRHGA